MMARLASAWLIVVKRALAHWRLLSAVVVGVVLACGVMAGTVIYFEALRELALKNALGRKPREELNLVVKAERGPTNLVEYGRVATAVRSEIEASILWLLTEGVGAGRSATFFLTPPGSESQAGLDNARGYFVMVPRLDEVAHILPGGRAPVAQALDSPGAPVVLEALVPEAEAIAFGLRVGDRLSVVPYWDDQIPHATVVVSGLFQKAAPADEFWQMEGTVFNAPTGPSFRTVPFYLSQEAYMDVLGEAFRNMDSTYSWVLVADTARVNARNAAAARFDIERFGERLEAQLFGYAQYTSLDSVLADYDRRLFFAKLPMLIVLILVAVVVLYYVGTLSSLLVDQQRGEVAQLRGRGASPRQVLIVFALEGATIVVLAIVVAPVLAAAVISLLGYSPAFSDLTADSRLVVNISASAYGMSALGGLFSFAAIMVPAIQASRVGVTQQRQQAARPLALPFFQRYYLDVILLVLAIFLFRQLTEQGSVVATRVFGQYMVNQMVLAVPAITLIAAAMVLLRLFPLGLNLASRVLSRWLPAGFALSLWQMARNPVHYARLSLLLILTAGLGIFAASFGATLERSFEERALYASGSDLRLQGVVLDTTGPSRPVEATYAEVPGVERAATAYRALAFDATKLAGELFYMFAVDGPKVADLAWFRGDFAPKPLQELLTSMQPQTVPEGMLLPDSAKTLGVTVKPDRAHRTVRVVARVIDDNGRWFVYDLGRLESAEWQNLEAGLSKVKPFSRRQPLLPVKPLTLMSVGVEETDAQRGILAGSILIDELYVVTNDGRTVVVEPFDDVSGWSLLRTTPDAISDHMRPSDLALNPGSHSVRFTWSEGPALTARGLFLGPPLSRVPVLATKSFLQGTGHSVGDAFEVSVGGHRVPVKIAHAIDYFPTLDTEKERFLIADLGALSVYANVDPSAAELKPNELWLATSVSGAQRASLARRLSSHPFAASVVYDSERLRAANQVDPLARAGWRALLFLSFGAVFVLSCVGFLVHAYVSFRNRQLQFALLRTIGLSTGQLVAHVLLEQALVIGVGMALGAWMGGRLGAIVMPFLAIDEGGSRVLPPFVLEVNWPLLLITYGVMVLVFAAISAGVIIFVRRISLPRTLRMGEL